MGAGDNDSPAAKTSGRTPYGSDHWLIRSRDSSPCRGLPSYSILCSVGVLVDVHTTRQGCVEAELILSNGCVSLCIEEGLRGMAVAKGKDEAE